MTFEEFLHTFQQYLFNSIVDSIHSVVESEPIWFTVQLIEGWVGLGWVGLSCTFLQIQSDII